MEKIKPNPNKKSVPKKKKRFEINTEEYDGKEQIVIDLFRTLEASRRKTSIQ